MKQKSIAAYKKESDLKLKQLKRKCDLGNHIHFAIRKLLKYDFELLKFDVAERALTHRLALYLQKKFRRYDVDCEYNRNGNLPKELNLSFGQLSPDDTEAKTVFPDIIVHKRGDSENLLVIEVKKERGSRKNDLIKLEAFCKQLGYQNALFLQFNSCGLMDFHWVAVSKLKPEKCSE